MTPLVFVALVLSLSDPALSLPATNDRQRFPPDAVLRDWYRLNLAHQCELRERMNAVDLDTLRPGERERRRDWFEAELRETERIGQAIMWITAFSDVPVSEAVMAQWLRAARGYLREDEWQTGAIPWGGLPAQ